MASKDTCDIFCYDPEKVERIQGRMDVAGLTSAVQLFKVIGDENRARITFILTDEEELCVCDIANSIGASVATASHHLRVLNKAGIVKYRKEGKLAFYSLANLDVSRLVSLAILCGKGENIHV